MIKFGQRHTPPTPSSPHRLAYFTIRSTHKETTPLIEATKVLSLTYKKRFYARKGKRVGDA